LNKPPDCSHLHKVIYRPIWQSRFSDIAAHPLLENNEKKQTGESIRGREYVPVVDSLKENHIELLIFYARFIKALEVTQNQVKESWNPKKMMFSRLINNSITAQLKRATQFELIRTASNLLNHLATNRLGLTYETQLQSANLTDEKNHLETYAKFEKEFLQNLSNQINAKATELSKEIKDSDDRGLQAALAPYLDNQGKLKASTALEKSLNTATAGESTTQSIQQQANTLLSSLKESNSTLTQGDTFEAQYKTFIQQVFQLNQLTCDSTNHEKFDQCLVSLLNTQAQFDNAFPQLDPSDVERSIQQIINETLKNQQAIDANEKKLTYRLFGNLSTAGQNNIALKSKNDVLSKELSNKQQELSNLHLYRTGRAATNEALKAIYQKIELAKNTPVATEAVAEKATSPAESSTSWLSSLNLAAAGAVGMVLTGAATLLPYALSSLSSAMTEDPASNTTFSL
jgi:hypothetical protein